MLDTHHATAKAAEVVDSEASRDMRILVIDDNELDRQRVLRLCQQAGLAFQPVEVAALDGLDAVLGETSFDLVFIDYLLAGETGLDAVDMLSAHKNQMTAAAIMLAGEGQINIAVEAMRRGCSDYMTKSMMNVETLQKSIATALERRILVTTIDDAQTARAALEKSVREYANACTAEMRSILSATLRRTRKLRTYGAHLPSNYSTDLNALELDVDRLWGALPDFQALETAPALAIENATSNAKPASPRRLEPGC
ncbi:MAG: response regulator [Silicimonas sp.]|nr:response regulator [Silicimonas sp.]